MSTRTIEVESYPVGFETKLKLAVPTDLPFWLTAKLADCGIAAVGAPSRTKATSPAEGIRVRVRKRVLISLMN
jgi:hypothetical protein